MTGSRVGRRLVLLLVGLWVAGCQGSSQGSAAQAIEAYLQARAESNVDRMMLLSCPNWQAQARVEASSFQAMNAKLEGVSCSESGSAGEFTRVACQGKIVTTYQGEQREWSVADQSYLALDDDGQWLMCGYGE